MTGVCRRRVGDAPAHDLVTNKHLRPSGAPDGLLPLYNLVEAGIRRYDRHPAPTG